MQEPVAPRKRGTLTSSTTAKATRSGVPSSNPNAPATRSGRRAGAAGDTDDLASRLAKVALDNNARSDIASRTTARLQSKVKVASTIRRTTAHAPTPAAAYENTSQSIDASLSSINKTLSELSGARQTTIDTSKTDSPFAVLVERAYSKLRPSIATLRTRLARALQDETRIQTRQLSIERSAILLVSYCIDTSKYDLAIEQLKLIRSGLIQIYKPEARDCLDLLEGVDSLNIRDTSESSLNKAASRSTTVASTSSRRSHAAVPPKSGFPLDFESLASLICFPAFPEVWSSTCPCEDVCTSILVVQHQLLSCLYAVAGEDLPTSVRPTTSPASPYHTGSGTTSPQKSDGGENTERNLKTILATLQSSPGGPLSAFQDASKHLAEGKRSKVEHSISAIYSLIMKKTVESASKRNVDPAVILGLEIYALECLLENHTYFAYVDHADEGTPDKPVQSMVNSLHRTIVSFGKMSTVRGTAEAQVAVFISERIVPLLHKAHTIIKPGDRLTLSKIYQETIDLLLQLFSRVDIDTGPLRAFMIADDLPIVANQDQLGGKTSDALEARESQRRMRHAYTRLTAETVTLTSWIKAAYQAQEPSLENLNECMCETMQLLQAILKVDPASPEKTCEVSPGQIQSNLVRSLERLHHYTYKAYKSDIVNMSGTGARHTHDRILRPILSSFCDLLLEDTLPSHSMEEDLVGRAIDTLLLFCRTDFDLNTVASFRVVAAYLQRVTRALTLLPSTATVTRLTSSTASTAHGLGRQLYDAAKYANAIPFLDIGCNLTVKVIEQACQSQDSKSSICDLWDKLAVRFELLASSHQQCRDRQAATQAYKRALMALYRKCSFPNSPSFQQDKAFIRMLAKYTHVSVLDLLSDPAVASVVSAVEEEDGPLVDEMVRGQLFHLQSISLQSHYHKAEAAEAASIWLKSSEAAFQKSGSNLDLAKVTLERLRILALSPVAPGLATDTCPELAKRIVELCTTTIDPDKAAQYSAFAKLFVAIDAVRRRDRHASRILAREAKAALTLLRHRLVKAPVITSQNDAAQAIEPKHGNSPLGKVRTGKAVEASQSMPAGPNQNGRKPLSPKSRTAVDANKKVTPPRRPVNTVGPNKISPISRGASQDLIDDFPFEDSARSLTTLSVIAQMLGVFEHSFLRLAYLRILQNCYAPLSVDEYVMVTLDLVAEYTVLGKLKRAAENMELAEARNPSVGLEIQALIDLQKAQLLAHVEKPTESYTTYCAALRHAERAVDEESPSSTRIRIMRRTVLLQQAALAAESYSHVAQSKGDTYDHALSAALQATRLVNRALSNLSRVAEHTSVASGNDLAEALREPSIVDEYQKRRVPRVHGPLIGLSNPIDMLLLWQIHQLMIRTLLRTADLYVARGTVRLAMYFLQQCLDLAEALAAPRLRGKVLAKQILLHKAVGDDHLAVSLTAELAILAAQEGGLSTLQHLYITGRLAAQGSEVDVAEKAFSSALAGFEKLDKAFDDTEAQFADVPKRTVMKDIGLHVFSTKSAVDGPIMYPIQRDILHDYVTLLQDSDPTGSLAALLLRLENLPRLGNVEDDILKAKLQLARAFRDLRQDPIAGLLHESVLDLGTTEKAVSCKSHLPALVNEVELMLLGATSRYHLRACPAHWRRLATAIAHLRILRANMGHAAMVNSSQVASSLESATSVAARREMLDVLNRKLTHGIQPNDLDWPQFRPRLTVQKPSSNCWQNAEVRYKRYSTGDGMPSSEVATLLPRHWAALSLHLTPDMQSIIATRYDNGRPPLVVQLPLDRVGRRDGEDCILGFSQAREELFDIIARANATSQNAKNVVEIEARRAWWSERKALDQRLAVLLGNMERKWFGVFRSVLSQPLQDYRDQAKLVKLTDQLSQVIRKAVLSTQENKYRNFNLDSMLLRAFQMLPTQADDDDLEDWLHYVVDSLQFSGVRVACDEIDVDQAVVDLRAILEEDGAQPQVTAPQEDNHLFLILDKSMHAFPWESFPSFARLSISRIPSLPFLQDRIKRIGSSSTSRIPQVFSIVSLNPRKTYFVLNPGGDLKHTEKVFSDVVNQSDWNGVTGRQPMEEEMRQGLATADVFLYFGHGGGEQYVRPHVIQALSSCATAFLWGCSSGEMKEQGEFEECGTPLVYMQAGAPALVGNLWDVTDKDLDRYTLATLEKFGLIGDKPEKESLPRAIAMSRDACSLRYLNGAAPVVWGIPVKLQSTKAV